MNIIFIETPDFIAKIDSIAANDEFIELQDELLVTQPRERLLRIPEAHEN